MTPVARAQTFYDVLSVPPGATMAEIRAAWRAQVMRLHPDRAPGDRIRSEAQLREINRAYAILKDPATRTAYDASLVRKAVPLSPAPVGTRPGKIRKPRAWAKAMSLAREVLWPFVPVETRHGR